MPRRPLPSKMGGVKRLSFRIDAKLPDAGPSRALVVGMLVVGGLVAISVPVFLGLVVYGAVAAGR